MKSSTHLTLKVPVFDSEDMKLLKVKAIPFSKAASPDETAVYRNALSPNEIVESYPEIKTVQDMIQNSVKNFGDRPFLGSRSRTLVKGQSVWSDYIYKSYAEFDEDRRFFGAGLMNLYNASVTEKTDRWFMGIYSINRYEWMVADMGAGLYSVGNVALYDTLGPETSEFIINHSESPIIVSTSDKVATLLTLAPKCPKMKAVIIMDSIAEAEMSVFRQWAAQVKVRIASFMEILSLGKSHPIPVRLPSPDDILCISYTSGTTGNPKGAMLTHKNMIATLRAASYSVLLDVTDSHISYLPMAHIFEKVLINCVALCGASAGFYRGDVTLLVEDIGVLKPTFFASVPRLLNRIHDKIIQGATHSGSALKEALFKKAVATKIHYLHTEGSLTHAFWDRIVFSKVRQLLGGRLRYCEMKLVSVPEMNYLAKDLKGEVWVRGPNVFAGYLKDKAKTEEAITSDGWLKTGDIGAIDQVGHLSIVDRKKNIFKLAQGEYVAPEKLENFFLKSPFVAQIYVHGDSLQAELVGVVVPDQEYGIMYGIEKGLLPKDTVVPPPPVPNAPPHELIVKLSKTAKFQQAIFDSLVKVGRKEKLRGFEFLKAIYVEPHMFSADKGLLTPTFKLKRPSAAEYYRAQIDQMYKDLEAKRPPAKL